MVRSKIEEEITILPTLPSVTLVMFTVVSSSLTAPVCVTLSSVTLVMFTVVSSSPTAPVYATLSSVPPGRSYLDHVDLFRCGGVIDL